VYTTVPYNIPGSVQQYRITVVVEMYVWVTEIVEFVAPAVQLRDAVQPKFVPASGPASPWGSNSL